MSNNKFKFLSYEETPSVEGQKGIATVLFLDEIILRLKLINKKDGTGYFVTTGTIKGEPLGDKNTWLDAFTLERSSVKEELQSFVRAEVNKQSLSNPWTPIDNSSGVPF